MILPIILIIIIIFIANMNVVIANVSVPDGHGLMASNNGHSCAHHHCCRSTVAKGWLCGLLLFVYNAGRDPSRTRGHYQGDHGLLPPSRRSNVQS